MSNLSDGHFHRFSLQRIVRRFVEGALSETDRPGADRWSSSAQNDDAVKRAKFTENAIYCFL